MVYFTTIAFNAQETLPRTVESVLAQTCGDFRYHLCDNGSEDGTGDLVEEYARQDKRVIPFHNEKNKEWSLETDANVLYLMFHIDARDWFATLDADDDYEPDFLSELMRFSVQEDLDFAVCRSNFIEEPTKKDRNEFVLTHDILVEGEGFGILFPQYFRFMGAKWGKLYRGRLFKRFEEDAVKKWLESQTLSHRTDTAQVMYYLRYADRVGVRAKPLHNYHLYPGSASTKNLEKKHRDNRLMTKIYKEYLYEKVGFVSVENEKFIEEVFERAERRTREQEEQG